VRTNSESLLASTTMVKENDFSTGIAITSILNVDKDSHIELTRYPKGSGFFRIMILPATFGKNVIIRIGKIIWDLLRHPLDNIRVLFVKDWAKSTQILLFMQTLESTLKIKRGFFGGLKTGVSKGEKPTPFIPLAYDLANRFSQKTGGKTMAVAQESILGVASTAHILGGACMGKDISEGVIDKDNHVFGYEDMLICDGSMISANIGVNPSLTITALSERAMSKVAPKKRSKKIKSVGLQLLK